MLFYEKEMYCGDCELFADDFMKIMKEKCSSIEISKMSTNDFTTNELITKSTTSQILSFIISSYITLNKSIESDINWLDKWVFVKKIKPQLATFNVYSYGQYIKFFKKTIW